jgi:hypothetical protein
MCLRSTETIVLNYKANGSVFLQQTSERRERVQKDRCYYLPIPSTISLERLQCARRDSAGPTENNYQFQNFVNGTGFRLRKHDTQPCVMGCANCSAKEDNTDTPDVEVIYQILFSPEQYSKSTHLIKIEVQI